MRKLKLLGNRYKGQRLTACGSHQGAGGPQKCLQLRQFKMEMHVKKGPDSSVAGASCVKVLCSLRAGRIRKRGQAANTLQAIYRFSTHSE